ncbi:MAG: LPS export ABC transporter periplasmic protein LptC [Spirochaetales bacterium]|nr:LPS export ABC transporter periplasmic protein LptC [Spirochaetales bacterium]
MEKNKIIFFILIFMILLVVSCSLDYSSANVADDLSERIPETIFINFSQVQVKAGKITNKLEATRAESYTKKKEMVLENVQFLEYDESEEVITEGKADRAILYTETDDADMFGNIFFYSHTEKTAIYADTLFWKDKEQKLLAEPDEIVNLKKDDGSFLNGKGFSTDFRLREIIFTKSVRGSYTTLSEGSEQE